MKKIQVEIPHSWKDVSLEMFDKLSKAIGDKDFRVEPSTPVIKAITGLDDETINNMDIKSYQKLVTKLAFLTSLPLDRKIPKKEITLLDKTYSILLYPQRMTTAQFIDYRTILLNDKSRIKQAKLLTVFIVPKGANYNDGSYDFDELANIIYKNLNIEFAMGLLYFFEVMSSTLLLCSLESSLLDMKRLLKTEADPKIQEELKKVIPEMKNQKKEYLNLWKKKNHRLKALTKSTGHK